MRYIFYILLLVSTFSFAQEEEKQKKAAKKIAQNLTWEANKKLSENDFVNAEADYRKAIHKNKENSIAPYNLGNAYYNNKTYNEAFTRYKQAGELATNKTDKHNAYHNMGNVFMKNKEYEKAINAYKEALRNNSKDEETRYNLALAKEMLKKEEEENKKNDKNKDNKDDKNKDDKNKDNKDGEDKKDKNKGDKENKDQNKDDKGEKDDQEKDKKDGEGDKKEEEKDKPNKGEGDKKANEKKQQQPRPNQLSKQQVKNLLEAMQNEEKKVQEKVDAQKVKGVRVKTEKDW